MVCRELKPDGPIIFGSQTQRDFGSAFWFGPISGKEGPWTAPLFTWGFLFYLAFLLWRQGQHKGSKKSLLRPLVVYYIIVTALVEITRFVWDVSRFALVWAALHNLAEWGIIVWTMFSDKAPGAGKYSPAQAHWWWSQLWILVVANWVMFAPCLMDAGIGEQIAGLTCDWLLMIVWGRLWWFSDAERRSYVKYGLLGSIMHMAEILPLVGLLEGFLSSPSIPGCILISVTTPITYYLYSQMVKGWELDTDSIDLVCKLPAGTGGSSPRKADVKEDGSIKDTHYAGFILLAALLSTATILGPITIFPEICPETEMAVPPTATRPPVKCLIPTPTKPAGQPRAVDVPGSKPTSAAVSLSAAPKVYANGATNETLCPSASILVGTTVVWARPGDEKKLLAMAASMPGPIRQEHGNIFYELAAGGPNTPSEIRYFESWSSISTMYRHIYTSPTVRSVFFSEAFSAASFPNMSIAGPFTAMIPCSEAQAEAQPISIPFSILLDAPVEALWAKINAWGTDYSWVQGAQGITQLTPDLRIVHFKGASDTLEIRQVAPLPLPTQPKNGRRLIYHVLGASFMDPAVTPYPAEAYQGDLTLIPSQLHPGKTVFQYQATVTAVSSAGTAVLEKGVKADFEVNKLPFLAQWAKGVSESASA